MSGTPRAALMEMLCLDSNEATTLLADLTRAGFTILPTALVEEAAAIIETSPGRVSSWVENGVPCGGTRDHADLAARLRDAVRHA